MFSQTFEELVKQKIAARRLHLIGEISSAQDIIWNHEYLQEERDASHQEPHGHNVKIYVHLICGITRSDEDAHSYGETCKRWGEASMRKYREALAETITLALLHRELCETNLNSIPSYGEYESARDTMTLIREKSVELKDITLHLPRIKEGDRRITQLFS